MSGHWASQFCIRLIIKYDLTVPVAQIGVDIKNRITQSSFSLEYVHVITCSPKIAAYNLK